MAQVSDETFMAAMGLSDLLGVIDETYAQPVFLEYQNIIIGMVLGWENIYEENREAFIELKINTFNLYKETATDVSLLLLSVSNHYFPLPFGPSLLPYSFKVIGSPALAINEHRNLATKTL